MEAGRSTNYPSDLQGDQYSLKMATTNQPPLKSFAACYLNSVSQKRPNYELYNRYGIHTDDSIIKWIISKGHKTWHD